MRSLKPSLIILEDKRHTTLFLAGANNTPTFVSVNLPRYLDN